MARRDKLVMDILELPSGKALKQEFSSLRVARKKQRSLLSNLVGLIHTRKAEEGGRAFLYIWKKEEIQI